ncbi:MAG: hypothetical protein M1815_006278 [Lichina confinis]|nr:MAG: hypothetical protein M1815_006278 [Lichina confinis]
MTHKLHKVVALISGGKDSLFSLLHCLRHGHDVIALANLHPPLSTAGSGEAGVAAQTATNGVEDLDSYMYQTVGHHVVPLYEEALAIPLYRQEIRGQVVDASRSYRYSGPATHPDAIRAQYHHDETEDLLLLLERVIRAHPEIDAVSTGAILSDYQRTRVESVAIRLGLVPLSFLWQFPKLPPGEEASLLADMQLVGQESRLVKCASGGLDASFLWDNVASNRIVAKLARAMSRYGALDSGAILGEGGEYETLAVDGPSPLWKKRIIVENEDRSVVHGGGGSVLLRITKAQLAPKAAAGEGASSSSPVRVRVPELLDSMFVRLREYEEELDASVGKEVLSSIYNASQGRVAGGTPWSVSRGRTTLHMCNMLASKTELTVEEQMSEIVQRLVAVLQAEELTPDDIVFTAIFLRSMAAFPAVNKTYGALFSRPNPPARMTIGLGDKLPSGAHVMLSVEAWRGPRQLREGLHVQSQSYWAPANIGPYSQAIAIPAALRDLDEVDAGMLVYTAGQIPLVPASMELVADTGDMAEAESMSSFSLQAVLALQHLWRVGTVIKATWWAGGLVFIVGEKAVAQKARAAWELWARCHAQGQTSTPGQDDSSDEDVDLWDKKYGATKTSYCTPKKSHSLPDPECIHAESTSTGPPPLLIVQVDELPRGSSVEWIGLGTGGGAQVVLDVREEEHSTIQRTAIRGTGAALVYASFEAGLDHDTLRRLITDVVRRETNLSRPGVPGKQQPAAAASCRVLRLTVYADSSVQVPEMRGLELVRCSSVWGGAAAGRKLSAGVVMRLESDSYW